MDTPSPTVVKLTRPADILGALPYRIGFPPAESLVLICLEGQRRRDRLVVRADLEPPEQDEQVVGLLGDHAVHVGASNVVIVCYSEGESDPPTDDGRPPLTRRLLVDLLVEEMGRRGVGVVEALLVRGGRWWSYHCASPDCCPGSGAELSTELSPQAALFAAEAVLDGHPVLAGREELWRRVRPPRNSVADAVREQAVRRADQRLSDACDRGGAEEFQATIVVALRALAARWQEGDRDLSPDDAATIVLGLHHRPTRDEAMMLALDFEPAPLIDLFTRLASSTGDAYAAPVCTVLAWLSHGFGGGGALTSVACERALGCDPHYEMARLIEHGRRNLAAPALFREVTRSVRADTGVPRGGSRRSASRTGSPQPARGRRRRRSR